MEREYVYEFVYEADKDCWRPKTTYLSQIHFEGVRVLVARDPFDAPEKIIASGLLPANASKEDFLELQAKCFDAIRRYLEKEMENIEGILKRYDTKEAKIHKYVMDSEGKLVLEGMESGFNAETFNKRFEKEAR